MTAPVPPADDLPPLPPKWSAPLNPLPVHHVLRVTPDGLRVECYSAGDAECRTTVGTCLVTEQAEAGDFAVYYLGLGPAPRDGSPIKVRFTADGVYEWWETAP